MSTGNVYSSYCLRNAYVLVCSVKCHSGYASVQYMAGIARASEVDTTKPLDLHGHLSDVTKLRIEDMLHVRKLRENEANLSGLLRATQTNLDVALSSLEAESKSRREAVEQMQSAQDAEHAMRESLDHEHNILKTTKVELENQFERCKELQSIVNNLCQEKAALAAQLAESKKGVSDQLMKVCSLMIDDLLSNNFIAK